MIEKEEDLFSRWKGKRQKFIPDGIVDEVKYSTSHKKVLYILKEANGGKERNSDWDLKKFLRKGGRKQTWDNIALWQYGINNLNQILNWNILKSKINDKNFRKTQLESIAAINIKKEPGGHTANNNLLWDYSWKDRDLLREQISIYKPEIIVCCGTGAMVKEHQLVERFENWETSFCGIEFFIIKNKSVIINYCHPGARIDDNYKFYPLIETLKEIKML